MTSVLDALHGDDSTSFESSDSVTRCNMSFLSDHRLYRRQSRVAQVLSMSSSVLLILESGHRVRVRMKTTIWRYQVIGIPLISDHWFVSDFCRVEDRENGGHRYYQSHRPLLHSIEDHCFVVIWKSLAAIALIYDAYTQRSESQRLRIPL